MNILPPPKADIGYCTIEFEFEVEGSPFATTLRCPVNLAEDLYCAVTLEITIAENLTKNRVQEILAETLMNFLPDTKSIAERLH